MKYSILSLLVSSLLLVGCGSSDDSDSNTSPQNNGGSDQQNPKPASTAFIDEMSGIALREALLSGLVDTLISGTDDAFDGGQCKTGTMVKTENSITFNDCEGMYEDDDVKVSGQVAIADGNYIYNNLALKFPNGETQKVNGGLQIVESQTNVKVTSS